MENQEYKSNWLVHILEIAGVVIVVLVAAGLFYFWNYQRQTQDILTEQITEPLVADQTSASSTSTDSVMDMPPCFQAITKAKNTKTGEVRDFPSNCLPGGWIQVSNQSQ